MFPFGIGTLYHHGNYVVFETSGREFQYMRLEPNGHLNVYQLLDGYNELLYTDLFTDKHYGNCIYPTVCGNYGVCTAGQCRCPGANRGNPTYFRPLTSSGCTEVTPLSCQDIQHHIFLELSNVTCFISTHHSSQIDVESCKRACLSNCSCKAALFRYQDNVSNGNCSLLSQLFSFMTARKEVSQYYAITFVKVQNSLHKENPSLVSILVPSLSDLLVVITLVTGACYCYVTRRKKKNVGGQRLDNSIESSICVSNVLRKFSFDDLVSATQNFSVWLGRGGFGSVFEGNLKNCTKVAVKRLGPDVHEGRSEFLAEVKTIGSIHHFNLVRLIGFCAQKSDKLLVYEYMCNGTLDKWIFRHNQAQALNWERRKKIIVGIAKALEYLHDQCNSNIIHFDIKPQNILLDGDFNAKISDFGLARMIDKDKTNVRTVLKGTPGYIAPELIRGKHITVKTDLYSFGVVILEIICGRKNSDSSQGEYLIDIVKVKAEEDQLSDLVDERSEDMRCHKEDGVKMMRIAISCLQSDPNRRPSASKVVKVLEGLVDLEPISDYSFLTLAHVQTAMEASPGDSSPLMPLILSGPR